MRSAVTTLYEYKERQVQFKTLKLKIVVLTMLIEKNNEFYSSQYLSGFILVRITTRISQCQESKEIEYCSNATGSL